jgi:hypothetical protein
VPKSRSAAKGKKAPRPSGPAKSEVEIVRDAADALYRAAAECCHQHERVSRVHGKSDVTAELEAAVEACDHCDDVLGKLSVAYEQAAATLKPTGKDEGWWHRANALWLASREYLRRHSFTERASRDLKSHDSDQLDQLHTEFELEASALLGLRHAAEAYQKDRPAAR